MTSINPKKVVREWLEEKWNRYVQHPIESKTEQMENQVRQTFDTYSSKAKEKVNLYSDKAKETAYKPIGYYRQQKTFHRGLFWIAVGLLIVLWIISGS